MKSKTALILAGALMAIAVAGPTVAQQSAKDTPCLSGSTEDAVLKPYCMGLRYNGLHGMVIGGENSWQNAVNSFDAALVQKPDFGLAFAGRGISYYNLGDYDHAKSDFDRAIQLLPDDVESMVNRAILYDKLGHFDLALKDFANAIAIDPKFARAYHMRAVLFAQHKNYEAAVADYNQLLVLIPDDVVFADENERYAALYFRAYSEYYLKNYPAVIADCTAALSILDKDRIALSLDQQARALFLRGVAKTRSSDLTGGASDISAAKAKKGDIEDGFAKVGVVP